MLDDLLTGLDTNAEPSEFDKAWDINDTDKDGKVTYPNILMVECNVMPGSWSIGCRCPKRNGLQTSPVIITT